MNYSARISQRNVKRVNTASHQARAVIDMQLRAMQCTKRGHVKGKTLTVGAYRREVMVCRRCLKVISETPPDVDASENKSDLTSDNQLISESEAHG